jgi:uncharacterized protein DUF6883
MARLPNAELAVLDVRKLSDYCLDPAHRRGRNKARVFRAALGVTQEDAGWLRAAILDALPNAEVFEDEVDEYGSRWRVDVHLTRQGMQAMVRTAWILRAGDAVPRFVSCWVL